MAKKNGNSALLTIAIIAVAVSAIGFFVVWGAVFALNSVMFGPESGNVSAEVVSNAEINFTVDVIQWGQGYVTPGFSNATLDTSVGPTPSSGSGTWDRVNGVGADTKPTGGFTVKNIGNVNVNFSLEASQLPTVWIGGDTVPPEYNFNVTDIQTGSCTVGTYTLGAYVPAVLSPGTSVCSVLDDDVDPGAGDTDGEISIDIQLVIPFNSNKGSVSDVMVATFNEVP